VFDRNVKRIQKDRAATAESSREFDYLRDEVAKRLLDRLDDVKGREFSVVVDLGSREGSALKYLTKRVGIKKIFALDTSERMLLRDYKPQQMNSRQQNNDQNASNITVAKQHNEHRTNQTNRGLKDTKDESEIQPIRIVADEEFLPFAPRSVDLFISNLSLHWVNDLPGCLMQIRQSLKDDGLFLAAMFGGDTLFELRNAFFLAEQEREGGAGIHVSPFAGVSDIGNLLTQAGFALTTVDTESIQVKYADPFVLMHDLRGMAENNAAIHRRPYVSRDTILAAAIIYQTLYGLPDGTIPASFQIIYMIGWAPHASQPKPKPRGSATHSFAELNQQYAPSPPPHKPPTSPPNSSSPS
jgi:NADH dehydrogenase [ubiquinone] 1 alpha subcomplex assembly factor 5